MAYRGTGGADGFAMLKEDFQRNNIDYDLLNLDDFTVHYEPEEEY